MSSPLQDYDTVRREAMRPAGEAHALPFRAYTDRDLFELEMERIFRRDWVSLCPESVLANTGDYLAFDLAGEPVVVVRGDDGALRALSNVCRHRGTVLLDEGYGNARKFVCPYHAWTYDSAGRLRSVPYPGNVEVDKAAHCLGQFALEVWAGVIFVNLDRNAEPLAKRLTGIDRYLKNYQLDRYRFAREPSPGRVWRSNWKLVMENGMESYHLFRVHPTTFERQSPTRGAFHLEGSARWSVTAGATKSADRHPDEPATIGEFEREHYTLVSIPPSLVGILRPESWGWISVLPVSPDESLILGGAVGPGPARDSAASAAFFERFMEEDRLICERGQRGMRSRLGLRGGQLVELERVIVDFHQYVGWRLFDEKPPASWASPQAASF